MMSVLAVLLGLSGAAAQTPADPLSWAGLRDTADTLPDGEWAVRLPTGRTALGVRDGTEVWVQPIGMGFAGSRLGLEQAVLSRGDWRWSLAPSVGTTWSLREGGVELRSSLSATAGAHRLNLTAAVRGRVLRQVRLDDTRSRALSADRLLVPVALTHDQRLGESLWRTRLMVAVVDEGEALTYGTLSSSWGHAFGRLHAEVGAGVLVGQPSEHVFLGHYHRTLVAAYPTLDLWWSL